MWIFIIQKRLNEKDDADDGNVAGATVADAVVVSESGGNESVMGRGCDDDDENAHTRM